MSIRSNGGSLSLTLMGCSNQKAVCATRNSGDLKITEIQQKQPYPRTDDKKLASHIAISPQTHPDKSFHPLILILKSPAQAVSYEFQPWTNAG